MSESFNHRGWGFAPRCALPRSRRAPPPSRCTLRIPGTGLAIRALLAVAGVGIVAAARADDRSPLERRFLASPVQITAGMPKAGEGYFSPDMRRICYQAVPDGYPFYQIFVQPFDATRFDAADGRTATPVRVSPGRGRTTCSWFSPDGKSLLFASSHLDPAIDATEKAARDQAEEDRRTGRRRRYQWDFDPHMDIFLLPLDPASVDTASVDTASRRREGAVRLTTAAGYDAECSFSPDGRLILFVSDRDGDPDIYVMDADGGNVRQLTDAPGYDGGPFFSSDGRWIAYRSDRLEKDLLQIHVMRADGSDDAAVTAGNGVRWAPFWHPTRPWLIWTGADHSDPATRPNYDLWIARHAGGDAAAGPLRTGPPLRITDHVGADVLPAFSPDGTLLMWTASRDGDGGGRAPSSQLWASRLDVDAIEAALPAVSTAGAPVP